MWIQNKDGDLFNLDQTKAIHVSSTRVALSLPDNTAITLATKNPQEVMAKIVKALESGLYVLRLDD